MSYSDFLDFISNGCIMFLNAFINVSNSLIHNYIFITLLGLSIFITLFWWFYDNVVIALLKVKDNCDNWVDLKRRYKQFNDMKLNYISTNRYDVELLNYANLKINRELYYQFLNNENDLSFRLAYKSLSIKQEASKYLLDKFSTDDKILEYWRLKNSERVINDDDRKEVQDILSNF